VNRWDRVLVVAAVLVSLVAGAVAITTVTVHGRPGPPVHRAPARVAPVVA